MEGMLVTRRSPPVAGRNSLPWAVCRLSAPWPPIRCPGTVDGWPPSWPPPGPPGPGARRTRTIWWSSCRPPRRPTSRSRRPALGPLRSPGRPGRWRSGQRVLLDFHDLVLDRREQLVDLLQYEGGKARLTAMEEIVHLALTARYYARVRSQVLHDRAGERDGPAADPDRQAPRADGSGRHHRALELPAEPGDLRRTRGSGGRERHRAQTGPADAATSRWPRSTCSARSGCPTTCGRWSTGRATRSGRQLISQVDYVCFTGSTATGQGGRAAVRRAADRLLAGARREEPAAGARRRRRGDSRGWCGPRLLRQRRTAVRVDRADLRGRRPARLLHQRVRGQDPDPAAGSFAGLRARDGQPGQRRPARPGRGAGRGRARARVPGCSPVVAGAPTWVRCSTSRRC